MIHASLFSILTSSHCETKSCMPHSAPFFAAIGNSFESGEDSASFYITSLIYKIGMITSCILFVYLLGWFVQLITGKEIVVEQEVVIVEEVTRAQVEAEERAKSKKAGKAE